MSTRGKITRQTVSTPQSGLNSLSKAEKKGSSPPPFWLERIEEQLELQRRSIVEEISERVKTSEERVMQRFGEIAAELANLRKATKILEERMGKAEAQIELNDQLQSEIVLLKTHVEECQNQAVSTDLIINGLPYMDGENIENIFGRLCHSLNMPAPQVCSAFRLNKQSNSTASAVIIKLASSADRSRVFKSVAKYCKAKKRPLLLSDAGLKSEGKFHIHECLTKNNRELMRFAMQLRREQKLTAVFSIRGYVYVRVRPKCKAVKVLNIESIQNAVAVVT